MAVYVIQYRSLVAGDAARPYLGMEVTGINGQSGPVFGLVDSGADATAFPIGYATLMGYTPATLRPGSSTGIGGKTSTYVALTPSKMSVLELPEPIEIEIYPIFVPGAETVLWGRRDFMMRFDVAIMEKQQRFTITPT